MPYTQGVSLTMRKGWRDSPVFSPLPIPPASLVSLVCLISGMSGSLIYKLELYRKKPLFLKSVYVIFDINYSLLTFKK